MPDNLKGRRSREGAWIEIAFKILSCKAFLVAPARERGLKSYDMPLVQGADIGRSREGAWIEILIWVLKTWISKVAPVRERGLKWQLRVVNIDKPAVAPVRERGLK